MQSWILERIKSAALTKNPFSFTLQENNQEHSQQEKICPHNQQKVAHQEKDEKEKVPGEKARLSNANLRALSGDGNSQGKKVIFMMLYGYWML